VTIAAPPATFQAAKDAENAAESRILEDIYQHRRYGQFARCIHH
jgi:hypothetical protein